MQLTDTFIAWGYPNIKSTHKTTIMVTRDDKLTLRGHCIVAVKAQKGLSDLNPNMKKMIQNESSVIIFSIEAGSFVFEVTGRGHPNLSLTHPSDIVLRKSGFVCNRTLMIRADRAASDIPSAFLDHLKDSNQPIKVSITVKCDL